MGKMKEKGMREQERSEAWDRLDCLLTKHELHGKFEDWGVQFGLPHALHNVKEALINLGEKDIAKFMNGVIQEVVDAQACCGEGCQCHEEDKGGVGGDEVVAQVEATEVGEEGEVEKLGDGSEFKPL